MIQEKKLSLEELKVQSFWTTLSRDEQNEVKGDMKTALGTTFIRVFC